jgi:aminoglycoside 3-N-acetyltransferase
MILRLREVLIGLHDLRLERTPVIVHASLKAFGPVEGAAETIVTALESVFSCVIMPTFTYKTMIIPGTGPENNGMEYGTGRDVNRMAEFFSMRMPADRLMGIIPETLRRRPNAVRTRHPILSFAGIQADKILSTQTIDQPLEPIIELERAGGWVLLLGVDHTVNTAIHCAERIAGRPTFTRWALTTKGVVACPSFPGCSAGFGAITSECSRYTCTVEIGSAEVRAIPLSMLFRLVAGRLREDPLAMLCSNPDCGRCNQVRALMQKGEGA